MDLNEIKKFFLEENKSGYKTNENWLSKHHKDLYDAIISNCEINDLPFKEKVWLYINNQTTPPKCPSCDNSVNFKGNLKKGYNNYCSIKCLNSSKEHKNKVKEHYIKNFNVESHNQLTIIKEKKKKTLLNNYGVDNPMKSDEIKRKQKNTLIGRYDVDNPMKIKKVKEKRNSDILLGFESNLNRMLKRISDDSITFLYRDINEPNLHFFCYKCKEYFTITNNLLCSRIANNVEICLNCNKKKTFTKNIELLSNFFLENNIEFNLNDRKLLNGKELDFYLPKYNLAIEYNGIYWHSNAFINDKNYHLNKTELCEKQNIQLLHIFEDEMLYQESIIKSIIKSKLGIYDQRIYARKCEIKEVNDNQLIREFLNDNHIQGFIGSKIRLGLFYENELVSLMTFGKKRIALGSKITKEGEYELLRFCNKLNTQIIGGAGKLFKFFIKNYDPKSILTFADRRYSQGKLYKKLGFEFKKYTKPNYFYVKSGVVKRFNRFKFRKSILIKEGYDPNKTEYEIMSERGFFQLFDSGNMKFELIL